MGSEHLAIGRVGNQSPALNSSTSECSGSLQLPIYLLTNGRVRSCSLTLGSFTSGCGASPLNSNLSAY